jgi:hypothetical protein
MNNKQHESGLVRFFNRQEDNGNIQGDPNNLSQTSENMIGDENSDHDETPNAVKSYETQKITIKNELTQKERTNYTSVGNDFSFENNPRHQTREIIFLGKKTSEPGIPDCEFDMEQVSEIVIDVLTNNIQFLKSIYSNFYERNLDFKINKDLIRQKDFIEKNLDKNIKAILLMMMEDISPQEKEVFKNEIKFLLELELDLKDTFLPFFRTIFNMNLKNLLLFYVNDRIYELYNIRLKTLKYNPKYSDEEKIGIRKQILSYLKSQKELTYTINDHEMPFNLPLLNVSQLPINDINEENLSPENIDSVNQIENNQIGNFIENNEAGNDIENNETKNRIENNQTENHFENNQTENHFENNQTGNHNNIIAEGQEPNKPGQKLDDKTNNKPKGEKYDNLKRIAVDRSYKYLIDMIEKITKVELKKVSIYKDINKNSSEQFNKVLKKKIGEIIGRKNGEFIESILNSHDTSNEIIFLKNLFKTEFYQIVEIFINDIFFSFTCSNGDKIEYKTFNYLTQLNPKINKKSLDIKKKIKEILQADGRLREKSNKKNNK